MAPTYPSDYRPLGHPPPRFLVLLAAPTRRPHEPLALLAGPEASLLADTLDELIRDLAGWSVPSAGPPSVGRTGAHWLW